MAAGRLAGDRLVSRLGAALLVRISSVIAAMGLAVALAVADPIVGIVGFGAVGLGISNIIPVLFSSAGRIRGTQAGTALSQVATVGYLGFLTGPPLIGLVADVTSLAVGLGLVCAMCAIISAWAMILPGRTAPQFGGRQLAESR